MTAVVHPGARLDPIVATAITGGDGAPPGEAFEALRLYRGPFSRESRNAEKQPVVRNIFGSRSTRSGGRTQSNVAGTVGVQE